VPGTRRGGTDSCLVSVLMPGYHGERYRA
jgi:hypothetical protein